MVRCRQRSRVTQQQSGGGSRNMTRAELAALAESRGMSLQLLLDDALARGITIDA